MAKKALLGLAAAAAVLIGVFVTTGWPPTMPGSEGAIGAAKRHQAQQMTAQDVKLGDTKTQEFLQSDVVARLMADRAPCGRHSPQMRSGRSLPARCAPAGRLPPMRSGRSLPPMRSGRSLPPMRSGRSLAQPDAFSGAPRRAAMQRRGRGPCQSDAADNGAGRHSPTMRSGRRSPTMRSGRSLPTMRSGRPCQTMRSGRYLSTMRSGRCVANDALRQVLANDAPRPRAGADGRSEAFRQALNSEAMRQALNSRAADLEAHTGAGAK